MKNLKRIGVVVFPFGLALFTFSISLLFRSYPVVTEKFYSVTIYPEIASILSEVSVLLPFSLGDLFYIGLFTAFVIGITLLIFRKIALKSFVIRLLQVLAWIYIAFYWLWGFNYFRLDAHARLDLKQNSASTDVFIKTFNEIVNQTNKSYTPNSKLSNDEYIYELDSTFHMLQNKLDIQYPCGVRRVKHITFSNFFAKATILGYYGPFFNEVHVNRYLSVWDKPVVIAHEMSHQFGITSEAEANFYAWIVCTNSKDEFVRYCGWLYVLNYFIKQSYNLAERDEILQKIKTDVISDLKSRRKYWMSLRNETIDNAARNVNNVYLKSNNVERGINDYNAVVQLVVDVYMSSKMSEYFKD